MIAWPGLYLCDPSSLLTYLPFNLKEDVYNHYLADCAGEYMEDVSPSHFYRVWKTNPVCRLLRLRKYMPFTLCGTLAHYIMFTLLEICGTRRRLL
jgi:hypothetical protein